MAKPPGKKPADAVAAIRRRAGADALALIFAVFLTNPGADLRAGRSRRPARRSQRGAILRPARRDDALDRHRFVIITHNPITMARMNRLYGVTMAERGVSQLVSVDLDPRYGSARRASASSRTAGTGFRKLTRFGN